VSEDFASNLRQFSRTFADLPLLAARAPRRGVYQWCKAGIARTMGTALLLIFTPVILLCAALVRLTSAGPSFYSQVRLGRNGRQFHIYKLRTMKFQCEAKSGAVWSGKNDPRITPVGRVLRRLHLDELPQLWNIARGEMCFIGPRPERPEIVEKLLLDIPNFNERLIIQQGLTGLSQVLQEADTSVDSARRKLRHDMEYCRRESAWLDLRIIVGTALIIVGVKRPTVAQRLALGAKPARTPTPIAKPVETPVDDCIFDAARDLPKLCDSGFLGAV